MCVCMCTYVYTCILSVCMRMAVCVCEGMAGTCRRGLPGKVGGTCSLLQWHLFKVPSAHSLGSNLHPERARMCSL